MSDKKQFMKMVVAWATSKKIPLPQTDAGWKVLSARFVNELTSRADQVIGDIMPSAGHEGVAHAQGTHLIRNSGYGIDIADERDPNDYSDFDEMADEKEHAMHESRGNDLEAHIRYRNKQQDKLKHEAPFVRTMPPSAANSLLGGQATPNSNIDPIEVLRWVGENLEARNVSIAAGPVKAPLQFINTALTYRSFMRVQFGSYGYLYTAEVDIGPGQQLTVPCSFMSVSIGVEADNTNGLTAGPTLSATMGFDSIMRTAPLTRTKYADLIPSGQAQTFVVPLFAKRFYVILTNNTATANVQLVSATGGLIQAIPIGAANVQTAPFMLTPDTQSIAVTPGVATTTIRIIFELEL